MRSRKERKIWNASKKYFKSVWTCDNDNQIVALSHVRLNNTGGDVCLYMGKYHSKNMTAISHPLVILGSITNRK
jgi:hypothetical protein